jgi:lipoprotein-anchoring transpeptidase ErfK/SrfK
MTALRQLSFVYVVAAGGYSIAMMMSAHPVWTREAEDTAAYLKVEGYRSAENLNTNVVRPGVILAEGTGRAIGQSIEDSVFSHSRTSHPSPVRIAQAPRAPTHVAQVRKPPVVAARASPEAPLPGSFPSDSTDGMPAPNAKVETPPPVMHAAPAPSVVASTSVAPQPKPLTLVPTAPRAAPSVSTASLPPAGPPNAVDIIRVSERLRENLTSEMVSNFELFLYVSKADNGPWAQRMYVFQKQKSGDLTLLYNWPVSTGREKLELNPAGRRLATETPPGYYELDPHRAYAQYTSGEWGKPMPYAMFFNWVKDGNQTGLAIHAASGEDVNLLGQRASAGCIHLSEDNARTLFTMIRAQYRGLAPRFAVDRRTGTMSNDGILVHDASGNVKLSEGYKVLIFIEDYGGQNVVAALY